MTSTITDELSIYQATTDSNDDAAVKHHYTDFENSTYMVISKVAYLIGVPKRFFESDHEPPKLEWYDKLEADKNARIVRNLCAMRTALEQNYSTIYKLMRYEMKNLHSMPELIPQGNLQQLMNDGITIERANYKPTQYIIDINRHISNRINNCKSMFPIWLKWEYVRALFLMPNGLSEDGIKAAANEYYANKSKYPYQVYMNWDYINAGNILYNDKKFVSLLYEANEDYFCDLSKVTDAGDLTKAGIYKFLEESEQVDIVVDCENSDPFKLYATLKNLDQEALLSKINKVELLLFLDKHLARAQFSLVLIISVAGYANQFNDFSIGKISVKIAGDPFYNLLCLDTLLRHNPRILLATDLFSIESGSSNAFFRPLVQIRYLFF